MNKTDILAKEKFDGDLVETMRFIMDNFDTEQLNEYIADFTKEQSNIFLKELANRVDKKLSPEQRRELVEESFYLTEMRFTKEEVKNMNVNPFKAKVAKDFLKLLIVNGGLIAINLLSTSFGLGALGANFSQLATSISMMLTTIISLDTAKDLLNYFKFKKIKDRSLNENIDRGRSL